MLNPQYFVKKKITLKWLTYRIVLHVYVLKLGGTKTILPRLAVSLSSFLKYLVNYPHIC